MPLSLVEDLSTADATLVVDGRTLPVPSVVEDADGIRALLLPAAGDATIGAHLWAAAHSLGAAYLLVPEADGLALAMTAERFIERRTERPREGVFLIADADWTGFTGTGYRDLVQASEMAAEAAAPAKGTFVHLHTHSEYCLDPQTRVVTADLVWKPIGEVGVGEQLVGFGEDLRAHRSRMQRTTVLATKRVVRDCYRIILEDGTEIVASAQHGWVGLGTKGTTDRLGGESIRYGGNGRRWIYTKDIQPGRTQLEVWARPWEEVPQDLVRDASYLAGIADGEGWLREGQISFGQNPGPVLDEMHRACKALGYAVTDDRVQSDRSECRTFRLRGYETALRFVAQCRPVRFKGRTDEIWVGRRSGGRYSRPVRVIGLEHLGERETVALQTSTATFVAEGFLTHNSALDGLSTIPEMIREAVADGQTALAVTDHQNCAAHPELGNRAVEAGIKPIFGMEANLVADRHRRGRSWWVIEGSDGVEYEVEEDSLDEAAKKKAKRVSDSKEVLNDYEHITLWAMDEVGLRSLWAMSTEGYREGFYGRARIDYDTLTRHAEGVIASTGCLRGPLARPMLAGNAEQAMINVSRLAEIFDDRLYVEIHTNHLDEQIRANQFAVDVASRLGLPMIAAVDSHYAAADDRETHRAFLAIQQDKDLTDDTSLFAGGQDYHMKTEAEVREALAYLGAEVVEQAVANTVTLADRCTATLGGDPTPPVFSKATKDHPDPIAWDVERLIDLCLSNWERKVVGKPYPVEVAEERFEREMALLIAKAFCGYFLVVADYVNWAKVQGCLVGPGRGSGGGSLVAYLAGITELDPIEHDLDFDRFLTEGRTSLPDFDVDFPTTWRERLKAYIRQRWGEDYVLSIGTVTRLKPKQALNDAARVLKGSGYEMPWTVAEFFRKAVEEADKAAAGTKVTWEHLCAQYEDIIEPMRRDYPEIMGMMERIVGRLRSYGKHPAGVVVSTSAPLTDLPMRTDEEGNLISQFDMVALEALGYVKFDLLTLRTLDTVQVCVDLIEAKYGKRVNVYDWRAEYEDPQVWEQVADGHTLGIFQIETPGGTRMTRRYRPDSIAGLAADITIVRPGPMRSGLTDSFLRRRDGLEAVALPDPRLDDLLGPTYGAPIYQEQVMGICKVLGGYTSDEADGVRKILGKKQVEKAEAAGREFVARAVERGMAKPNAEALWAQLAEFAKYGFGKAHAVGYAVLGYWTAWLKFHFPVQFITAALSTVDDARLPEFVAEGRRMGYKVAPPDVNLSGPNFTPSDLVIRYGLANVKGVGKPTAEFIAKQAPFASLDDFVERCITVDNSPVNKGTLRTLVTVGAFDSIVENRRYVEMALEREQTGEAVTCVFKDPAVLGPGGLPCTFDWANETNPPMESKGRGALKVLTPKAPPKRCTVACRQYTKPPALRPEDVQPYTADDLIAREREVLGTWLSGSPFDRLDPEDLAALHTAEDVNTGPIDAEYVVAALVDGLRLKKDRNGNDYAFVTLDGQNGTIDAVCFASTFAGVRTHLRKDALVLAVLWKTDRGVQISALAPAI